MTDLYQLSQLLAELGYTTSRGDNVYESLRRSLIELLALRKRYAELETRYVQMIDRVTIAERHI